MTNEQKIERSRAKAGEKLSAAAARRMRESYPMMKDILRSVAEGGDSDDFLTVQPKTEEKNGQWACADCGEFFQNNMGASHHEDSKPKHRMVWWSGHDFQEA